MHTGTQLIAPEGFQCLEKDTIYYLLRSDPERERVLLVHFVITKSKKKTRKRSYTQTHIRSFLTIIQRLQFEAALADRLIVRTEKQVDLPPWLSSLEGKNLENLDEHRPRKKRTHKNRVQQRYQAIVPLLQRLNEVLGADNPDAEIAHYARKSRPQQSEKRLRLWLYTYLCFGRNEWVLLPPFSNCGHWERRERSREKKFGRPSLTKGAHHGYGCDQTMHQGIIKAYRRFRGPGITLPKVYHKGMVEIFGCHVRKDAHGRKAYFHPQGKPYPNYGQFEYHIRKEFPGDQIRRTCYGETRTRHRLSASKGQFSANCANLMERMEADGYFVEELPSGVLEGQTLRPLCVVRSRCMTSGALVGIGFALGSETSAAYRMMLFSMAADKVRFCNLFGLSISPDDWPCVGLPLLPSTDRGPGAGLNLPDLIASIFPVRELAPSWSPQSKATVESSHPRTVQLEGAPNYVQSRHNPLQLARREIARLLADNQATNVSARRTPEMMAAKITPSPLGVWNYLNDRGRSDAYTISFDTAVRTFLTPIDVTIRSDGVYLEWLRFDSPALRSIGLLDRVARGQSIFGRAYLLDLCVRHIWLDIDDQIVELDAQLPIRDVDEQLDISITELQALSQANREVESAFREHQHAVRSEYLQRVEQATGHKPDVGTRRLGKPKNRSASSRQEEADLAPYTSKRKKA